MYVQGGGVLNYMWSYDVGTIRAAEEGVSGE